jgi:SET domain-containing protein 6
MQAVASVESWLRGAGVSWDADAVAIVDNAQGCSGPALGIRAARDVQEGQRLCTIPKAACLSTRTSSMADLIDAERLGGGLGLVVAVMHEMSLGEESKWCALARRPLRAAAPALPVGAGAP